MYPGSTGGSDGRVSRPAPGVPGGRGPPLQPEATGDPQVRPALRMYSVQYTQTGFLLRRAWDSLNWRWLGLSYSAFSEDRERVMEAEEEDTGNTEEIAL